MKTMIERLKKKIVTCTVLALLVIGVGVGVMAQDDGVSAIFLPALANSAVDDLSSTDSSNDGQVSDEPYEVMQQRAIDLLAAYDEMALFLADYPGWVGNAWQNDDASSVWQVDFVVPAATEDEDGEWLGDGEVDIESGKILWLYAPRELTTEEFQSGLQKVEAFLGRDPEVAAMLGDPELWGHDTYYNRWEKYWETSYWYGLDAVTVRTTIDAENVYIDSIYDPNEFDAAERDLLNRNQAIEVAFQADGIDLALNNVDNWRTYVAAVETSGESQYTVEFVADGETLFAALVDIDTWTVLNDRE